MNSDDGTPAPPGAAGGEVYPREAYPKEPRWPAIVSLLAVGFLYTALPTSLAIGPRWLLLLVTAVLLVPTTLAHHAGFERANRLLGFIVAGIVTVGLVWSLALLLRALVQHAEGPETMLRSAAALWASNVLVFALWYWRLDAGGPHGRDRRPGHETDAFLFPQMNIPDDKAGDADDWSPQFVDYLFLAFNTSTAFSPTDTAVLDRWAKVLVMLQAGISLVTVGIVAARAVNIL